MQFASRPRDNVGSVGCSCSPTILGGSDQIPEAFCLLLPELPSQMEGETSDCVPQNHQTLSVVEYGITSKALMLVKYEH